MPGHYRYRRYVVGAGVVLLFALVLAPALPNLVGQLRMLDGYYLRRESAGHIYLTWNFESGVMLSPQHTLQWFNPKYLFGDDFPEELAEQFNLTPVKNAWMMDLRTYGGTPFTYADLINPKNRNAKRQIREIVKLASREPLDHEAIARLSSKHFICLGWTVQNVEQARELRAALEKDWGLDRSKPISTSSGTLYPLALAMLKKASEDANEAQQIESLASSIPVLMENVDKTQGHPGDTMHVLFLDGHIDEIPFGSKFPATQEFLDAIRLEPTLVAN